MVKDIKHEKCVRKTFAKTENSIDMPNLIKVQKDSYEWFVKEGLGEVLKDISPIMDYSGNLILEFFDYYMEDNRVVDQLGDMGLVGPGVEGERREERRPHQAEQDDDCLEQDSVFFHVLWTSQERRIVHLSLKVNRFLS